MSSAYAGERKLFMRRRDKSMEAYKAAGAAMRLLDEAAANAVVKASVIFPTKETDRLMRLAGRIGEFAAKADTLMFTDHPELSNEYTDVFFGNLSGNPRTEVDAEVVRLAKEQALDRFGNN